MSNLSVVTATRYTLCHSLPSSSSSSLSAIERRHSWENTSCLSRGASYQLENEPSWEWGEVLPAWQHSFAWSRARDPGPCDRHWVLRRDALMRCSTVLLDVRWPALCQTDICLHLLDLLFACLAGARRVRNLWGRWHFWPVHVVRLFSSLSGERRLPHPSVSHASAELKFNRSTTFCWR